MPTNIIVTSNILTGVINNTEVGNSVIVAEGVIVSRSVSSGVVSSAIQFDQGASVAHVDGSVLATLGEAISMGTTFFGSNSVTIGAKGTVAATYFQAVELAGGNNSLVNSGQISTVFGSAVDLLGQSCSLINNGNIDASGGGVYFDGVNARAVNNGSINTSGNGLFFDGNGSNLQNAGFVTGVEFNGDDGVVSNSGSIVGTTLASAAALSFVGSNGSLLNTGSITGINEAVLFAPTTAFGSLNTVTNDGLIAVSARNGNAFVSNTGNDTFTNRGQVAGNMQFKSGDDLLDNDGGTVAGRILFGAGFDELIGGAAAERAMGGTGADTLDFGGGNDVFIAGNDESVASDDNDELDGGDGIDTYDARGLSNAITVRLNEQRAIGTDIGQDIVIGFENVLGGFGSDILAGNSARNVLRGNGGNDAMNGLEGDDRLSGGIGTDTLTGSTGRDVMTGGIQADVFDFNNVADSAVGDSLRDLITDFFVSSDKIDLATIDANAAVVGDQSFTFVGTAGFTNGVAGQLRYSASAVTSYTIVEGDVNGDGRADFQIGLLGNLTLAGTDFFL